MINPNFPNESQDYRRARNDLLAAEIELRAQVEEVAQMRRQLPAGGEVKEDYVFDEMKDGKVVQTKLSDLFADGHDTLFLYNFMYGPSMDNACPMCASFLDGLDGQIGHIEANISIAIVAKHSAAKLDDFAQKRGWDHLRMLSSESNDFNEHYYGEVDGNQMPMANVFKKDGGRVSHFWSSEMLYADSIEGGNARHIDMMWPLWNILDVTPNGRGQHFPSL